jgi:dihydroorotate dehydrogenase
LVFRGLGLLAEIKKTLVATLDRDKTDNLWDHIGADAASVTAEPWPQ